MTRAESPQSANLYALLKSRFADREHHTFLEQPGEHEISYGEIDDLSARFASWLRAQGTKRGDRVVAQVDKSIASIALYLGCLRSGLVYVPLNTAYTETEIGHFLADSRPSVFVHRPQDTNALQSVVDEFAGTVAQLGTTRDDALATKVAAMAPHTEIDASEPDDIAALVYTSGTTGRSKGAMVTHRNLTSNALSLHRIWGWRPGDVLLHALPTFHVHGLFVALHTAMLNVSRVLFLPAFELDQVRQQLPRTTVMMGVPTFYTRLLTDPSFGRGDCAAMRLFISGSAPLLPATFDEFRERTGHTILERYGMTEAGMITSNPLVGERIAGTVGFALPEVEVRVVDETGKMVRAGTVGSVEARGPNIFLGYWGLPEKTAAEFSTDGFFRTGDLGSLDADDRLTLTGRAKDLIICGGYNVYPKEIEQCLDDMPGIDESAVIGVPHADMGEGVVAVIVREADASITEADIRQAVERNLARFKQPRHYAFVGTLPRNAMGKVQKNQLREIYQDVFQNG